MNREIKFRAWLKGEHNDGSIYFGDDGFMDYDAVVKDGCYCDVEGGWDIHGVYNSVPLMQYTGIKDKNGIEIYDGDVVRTHHFKDVNGNERFLKHIVKWSDKYLSWFALNTDSMNENDGSTQLWVFMRNAVNTEVIGNIYENPELLEVINEQGND